MVKMIIYKDKVFYFFEIFNEDKHHVNVRLDMDEMDLTTAERR